MKLSDFDFTLPEDLIALHPPKQRDGARLLYINSTKFSDRCIVDLPNILRVGDVLVLNTTKVIPAALVGVRKRMSMQGEVATEIEVNLHKRVDIGVWRAFVRPLKRIKIGEIIEFSEDFCAELVEIFDNGDVELIFFAGVTNKLAGKIFISDVDFLQHLHRVGHMPLPPYIARKRTVETDDAQRYQTIFANEAGSVAAPTAGLHFTPELLHALAAKGITTQNLTLHVGAGTFLPVKTEELSQHVMHAEWGQITPEVANALNAAKRNGQRIIPVGTTALRLLESATTDAGEILPFERETDIFITPGYKFKCVDALLTNFHLPKSTLFMLVCALGGHANMQAAYAHAMAQQYKFFSYGDACFIEPT